MLSIKIKFLGLLNTNEEELGWDLINFIELHNSNCDAVGMHLCAKACTSLSCVRDVRYV